MSDTEARVVVQLRERTRGQRSVRDRPARWDGAAPPEDLGQAIVDALAYVADLIAEFQDRIADEAYLGSGRQRPDRVDRPRAAGVDGSVVITMRDAASAERLASTLDANDDAEAVVVGPGRMPR